MKEFKRQFSLNIKINFYFVKKRLNIFSFNLDTRIHTSPKEDGHGSQVLGPKGVDSRRKETGRKDLLGKQLRCGPFIYNPKHGQRTPLPGVCWGGHRKEVCSHRLRPLGCQPLSQNTIENSGVSAAAVTRCHCQHSVAGPRRAQATLSPASPTCRHTHNSILPPNSIQGATHINIRQTRYKAWKIQPRGGKEARGAAGR